MGFDSFQFSVFSSQFSVLSSQFSVFSSQFSHLRFPFSLVSVNLLQHSSISIIVKPVAYDEIVWYRATYVIDLEILLETAGLEEKRCNINPFRFQLRQVAQHRIHCDTRVDNVLDNDDVATLAFRREWKFPLDAPRRAHSAIRTVFHETRLRIEIQCACQIGHEHERPSQRRTENRILVSQIARNIGSNRCDRLLNLRLGHVQSELFPVDSHHIIPPPVLQQSQAPGGSRGTRIHSPADTSCGHLPYIPTRDCSGIRLLGFGCRRDAVRAG